MNYLCLLHFLRCSLATDFLPTFMYCMGSGNFDVVQTALRNLPEYVLLCQGTIRINTIVRILSHPLFIYLFIYNIAFFLSLQNMQTSYSTKRFWSGSTDKSTPVQWSQSPWRSFIWKQQHEDVSVSLSHHCHSLPAFLTSVSLWPNVLFHLYTNNYIQ